jgi:C4-dicarboxylate transporter, DctM subunit
VAAGGTVGILIPPSLGFILYGILTQNSIGKLFLAGIIPGILQIVIYIVVVYILCRIHPSMGPAAPKIAFNQKVKSLGLVWPALLLFFLVIGGMYGGVFTATEAGAVGAFGALILSLAKRSLKLKGFWNSLTETAKISGIIILLLIGAYFFNGLLSVSRIPNIGSEFLVGLGLNKYVILTIILVIYVIMGMFFDSYSILVITVPVLYPAILAFGFDPIWYGVIMVRVIEMGLISPPFGINDFALSATANIPINKVYRGVIPFLISDVFNLIILVAIPVLSTYLPYMMITKS